MKRLSEREAAEAVEARERRFLAALHARKQQRVVPTSTSSFRRWIPVAATIVIGALFLAESQRAVSAADALVQQAATIEAQRPRGSAQRLRITLTPAIALSAVGVRTFSTEEDLLDGMLARSAPLSPDPLAATLVQTLKQHRFDWRQPLSVQHFDAWRKALVRKQDFVIDLRESPNIILRTITVDDGDLREVELTVQRDSYRVVKEVLRFEDGGMVEIVERAQWARNLLPTPAPRETTVVTTRSERPAPAPAAPLAALTQPDLRRWLANRFDDLSTREQFMPELLRQTTLIRQHLEALRDLSGRYPGADGAQASLAARSRLQRQVDLQYDTLRGDLSALSARILALTSQSKMAPRRASFDASKPDHAPSDWEDRVDEALTHAGRLNGLMRELRTLDDLPTPMSERIANAFDSLWTAIYAPDAGPNKGVE